VIGVDSDMKGIGTDTGYVINPNNKIGKAVVYHFLADEEEQELQEGDDRSRVASGPGRQGLPLEVATPVVQARAL
jgi:hypothetical protein